MNIREQIGFSLIAFVFVAVSQASLAAEQQMPPKQVVEWLEERLPHVAEELRRLHTQEPEEFAEAVDNWRRNIAEFQEVHSRYPEAAERLLQAERLEHESWQLVGQIGESEDDAKKQRLTSALRQNLNEIFDAKLIERSLEVRELENEIKELNVLISRRESMKDSIVERRLAEMIAEADEASRWW